MALLFMDGCDHWTGTVDHIRKWSAQGPLSASHTTTGGRFGGGAIALSSYLQWMEKQIPALSTVIVGWAVKTEVAVDVTPDEHMIAFNTGSQQQIVIEKSSTDNKIRIFRDTTELAVSSNTFDFTTGFFPIEVKVTISQTVGAVDVRVDGVSEVSVSGVDTQAHASVSTVNRIRFWGFVGDASPVKTTWIDDIYILDDTGSSNNDFLGDTKIVTLNPDASGNYSELTRFGGGSNNFEAVDEAQPDDDTTYNHSATATNKDSYGFDNITTSSIFAIQAVGCLRRSEVGFKSLKLFTRIGGTDYFGSSEPMILDDYRNHIKIWEENPDTAAAWVAAGVNGAEFGVEVQ